MAPFARQNQQIKNSDNYIDGFFSKSSMESGSNNLEYDLNAIRTQIKNILGEDNWYDSPQISIQTLFGSSNRLWYKIQCDSGYIEPAEKQDTVSFVGIGGVNVLASDGKVLTISCSKNVYKTIETNDGFVTADLAQDTLFFAGEDEISTIIGENQITISFSSIGTQKHWDTIAASNDESESFPIGTWTSVVPDVEDDVLNIVGENGISIKAEIQSDLKILKFESQDLSQTGSPSFSSIIISSLNKDSILFVDNEGIISGDYFNFNYNSSKIGIGIYPALYDVHISGDIKIEDSSIDIELESEQFGESTFVLIQNGYVYLFVNDADFLIKIFKENFISDSLILVNVPQPIDNGRIVRGAKIIGDYLITISDSRIENQDNTLGHFDIWNISNMLELKLISSLSSSYFYGSKNIEIKGRYCFFGSEKYIINVIDVFNVNNPVVVQQIDNVSKGSGVIHIVRNRLFALSSNTEYVNSYDLSELPNSIELLISKDFYHHGASISNMTSVKNFIFFNANIDLFVPYFVYDFDNDSIGDILYFQTGSTDFNKFFSICGSRMSLITGFDIAKRIQFYSIDVSGESLSYEHLFSEDFPNFTVSFISFSENKIYVTGEKFIVLKEKGSYFTSCESSSVETGNLEVKNKMEVFGKLSSSEGMIVGSGGLSVKGGGKISSMGGMNIRGNLSVNLKNENDGISVSSGNILFSSESPGFAQFDTIFSGDSKADNVLIEKNVFSNKVVNVDNFDIGAGGMIVNGDFYTFGPSVFGGEVSIGGKANSGQIYTYNGGVNCGIKNGNILGKKIIISSNGYQDTLENGFISCGYGLYGGDLEKRFKFCNLRFDSNLSTSSNVSILLSSGIKIMFFKGNLFISYDSSQKISIYNVGIKNGETEYSLVGSLESGKDYSFGLLHSHYLLLWEPDDSGTTIDVYDIFDEKHPVLFSSNSISSGLGSVQKIIYHNNYFIMVCYKEATGFAIHKYRLEIDGHFSALGFITESECSDLVNVQDIRAQRGKLFVLTNDSSVSKIVSFNINGELDLIHISTIQLTFDDQKVFDINGKYAVLPSSNILSDKVTIVDISDPSSMIEIFQDKFSEQKIYFGNFYGSRIVSTHDSAKIQSTNILGFRGQFGRVGSLSVDKIDVSNDFFVSNKSYFGSSIVAGDGGVSVFGENGVSTNGRIIASGSASFGSRYYNEKDVSISDGDFEIEQTIFTYGDAIDTYEGNTENGFIFCHAGVIYPVIKNRPTKSVIVSDKKNILSTENFMSEPFTDGFLADSKKNISVTTKYLIKLNDSKDKIRFYDFENLIKFPNFVAEINLSGVGNSVISICTVKNILFILLERVESFSVLFYQYYVVNEEIFLSFLKNFIELERRPYNKISVDNNLLYVWSDLQQGISPVSVFDISDVDNVLKITASIKDFGKEFGVIDSFFSENFIHMLCRDSNNVYFYLKINKEIKNNIFDIENSNFLINCSSPWKIISFGKYSAILDSISGGNDRIYILDSESLNSPIITVLSDSNIPDIQDILFYKNFIYVLGLDKFVSIELNRTNAGSGIVGNIYSDSLFSEKLFSYAPIEAKSVYIRMGLHSDGIIKTDNSLSIAGKMSIGSSKQYKNIGSYIEESDFKQVTTKIGFLGSEILNWINDIIDIVFTKNNIYSFYLSNGIISGDQLLLKPRSGNRILGENGNFVISGLDCLEKVVFYNNCFFCINSAGDFYCVKERNNRLEIVGEFKYNIDVDFPEINYLIAKNGIVVAVSSFKIFIYDVSNLKNIHIKTIIQNGWHIDFVSFYKNKIQIAQSVHAGMFEIFYYDIDDLKNNIGEMSNVLEIDCSQVEMSNIRCFYREDRFFYFIDADAHMLVGKIDSENDNFENVVIDSFIQVWTGNVSQSKIIKYGKYFIVGSDLGIALIRNDGEGAVSSVDLINNDFNGFYNYNLVPFGYDFNIFMNDGRIYYYRNNNLYTFEIKSSDISHVESGSIKVSELNSDGDIFVGRNSNFSSIDSSGKLSVLSDSGLSSNVFSADKIIVNKKITSKSDSDLSSFGMEINSGKTVFEQGEISLIKNISVFNGTDPGVMVCAENKIYIFATSYPLFSVFFNLNFKSLSDLSNTLSKNLHIDFMVSNNDNYGISNAFVIGRKVYAVQKNTGVLVEIDSATQEQRRIPWSMDGKNVLDVFSVGTYIYCRTENSVNRYFYNGNNFLENGKWEFLISKIAYGEGKLFAAYIDSSSIYIILTETAKNFYSGTAIHTYDTKLEEEIVDFKFFKNYLYLLTKQDEYGQIYKILIYDDGEIGNYIKIIGSKNIFNSFGFEILENRIYFFTNDSIVVFDTDGNEKYTIHCENTIGKYLINKNLIFTSSTNMEYEISIFKFVKSSFSIGEIGAVVSNQCEIKSDSNFLGNGEFRAGLSCEGSISSDKGVLASKGFCGQACFFVQRIKSDRFDRHYSVVASNLPSQTGDVDLFYVESDSHVVMEVTNSPFGGFESFTNTEDGFLDIKICISGMYQIRFNGVVSASSPGEVEFHLCVNGNSVRFCKEYIESVDDGQIVSCLFLIYLTFGDLVKIIGVRSSGQNFIQFNSGSSLFLEKIN